MTTGALRRCAAAELLVDECADLELTASLNSWDEQRLLLSGPSGERVEVALGPTQERMIEQVLRQLQFNFDALPLLVMGDSKEIRLLTPRIALARFLPTVYSFTSNRYGRVEGTDHLRARFAASVFRRMNSRPGRRPLSNAFLGLIEATGGPLLAERNVPTCNLEVRVKRYHVGSPVHRYRYTELHKTAHGGPPVTPWMRFESPVVCFDWRHPLTDGGGNRLADEPLSDDYAAGWMDDVPSAKRLVRQAFEWLEEWFAISGLRLIDICFFVDRTGTVIYGEISPDCMRVRSRASADAEALDKDEWRSGGEPEQVFKRYSRLSQVLFGGLETNPIRRPNGSRSSQEP